MLKNYGPVVETQKLEANTKYLKFLVNRTDGLDTRTKEINELRKFNQEKLFKKLLEKNLEKDALIAKHSELENACKLLKTDYDGLRATQLKSIY
jgi:hypothetical protein